MKRNGRLTRIVLPAVFLLVFSFAGAEEALAWGSATHAGSWWALCEDSNFPTHYKSIVSRHRNAYILGTILPDVRSLANVPDSSLVRALFRHYGISTTYYRVDFSTHNLYLGLDLLRKAQTDEQKAFALGWLSHETCDCIAQCVYVPMKMNEYCSPFGKTSEDIIEAMIDYKIWVEGHRGINICRELVRALETINSNNPLIRFLYGVVSDPHGYWKSRLSYGQFYHDVKLIKDLMLLVYRKSPSGLYIMANRKLWGLLSALNRARGRIKWPIIGLLSRGAYNDWYPNIAWGVDVLQDFLEKGDAGSDWREWCIINPHAIRFGGQQWYNWLCPTRDKNKSGLIVYDFSFMRKNGSGSFERIDHASQHIGSGNGAWLYFNLCAWKPVNHSIKVAVRRDVDNWFDRTLKTSPAQRITFSRRDIRLGRRRTMRMNFRFRSNKWRWKPGRWPWQKVYTQGFYAQAFLNRDRYRQEEFCTKADWLQRLINKDSTYNKYPYSLDIVKKSRLWYACDKSGSIYQGTKNAAPPTFFQTRPGDWK
jgi:hypothetical protein